jgi:hypothetical protein
MHLERIGHEGVDGVQRRAAMNTTMNIGVS